MRLIAVDLHYRYPRGDRLVLAGVSFDIPSGSRAAIVGPSGSGKTTLLSLVGGLLPPQGGTFRCEDGEGRAHVPGEVATWIVQTVSLLPERTVEDNVCLGAYLDGASRDEARERSHASLEAVGLRSRATDPASLLSGGEAQRVAIARALASRRPIMFADEPTGQLDAATSSRVLDALFADESQTVLLITHDEAAAARCDLVFDLSEGVLCLRARALREPQ